mmetsp:Transcript_29520/g.48104  ORF Transcript_29520/g.48104 Transcript_29520/m.48104 type:complete len:321 (-) Transcript_29520:94-1056(-)
MMHDASAELLSVHPIESNVTHVWNRLVRGKSWISEPAKVVRSFVADASMEKIMQQTSKHEQFITRAMNVNDDQKIADGNDAYEFGTIQVKLNELQQLRHCLPETQASLFAGIAMNNSADIIMKGLDTKINAQIMKLTDSEQKYISDVEEFVRALTEYQSAMCYILRFVPLQTVKNESDNTVATLNVNVSAFIAYAYKHVDGEDELGLSQYFDFIEGKKLKSVLENIRQAQTNKEYTLHIKHLKTKGTSRKSPIRRAAHALVYAVLKEQSFIAIDLLQLILLFAGIKQELYDDVWHVIVDIKEEKYENGFKTVRLGFCVDL